MTTFLLRCSIGRLTNLRIIVKPTRLCGQYIGHNRGEFGSFVLLGKGMAAVSRYWPSQSGNGNPCYKRRRILKSSSSASGRSALWLCKQGGVLWSFSRCFTSSLSQARWRAPFLENVTRSVHHLLLLVSRLLSLILQAGDLEGVLRSVGRLGRNSG